MGMLGSGGFADALGGMPIVGGFFEDPAEARKKAVFSQSSRAYQAQRPEDVQTRMNAMRNQLSNYQPAADLLTAMNGGRNVVSPQVNSNPMGPSALSQGAPRSGKNKNQPGVLDLFFKKGE